MRTLTKDHLDNLRAGIPPSSACPGMDVAEVIDALVATVDARTAMIRGLLVAAFRLETVLGKRVPKDHPQRTFEDDAIDHFADTVLAAKAAMEVA